MSPRLPEIQQGVEQHRHSVMSDSHYPHWHNAPTNGLMNDPNGFIQFAAQYHLFYQWNPFACDHTFKCWGHWFSTDLIHWHPAPVALLPDEEYDRNGCYSGCAIEHNGMLKLCYTGNVKFADDSRTAWQCMASQNTDGTFSKQGPVLPLPEGYTGHVRDPKIWRHDDRWYMVLGAQDLQRRGKVLLFSSGDLQQWQSHGEIAGHGLNGVKNGGYMWECPDMFPLGEEHILVSCPQGLPREARRFLNTYPVVWMRGLFDYIHNTFDSGPLHEVDSGFEFYAPHTTMLEDGRRLLIGWMGVPEGEEMDQPTRQSGWLHQMTCIRELDWHNGRLYQRPLRELTHLRGEQRDWQGNILPLEPIELAFDVPGQREMALNFAGALKLIVNNEGLRLSRQSLKSDEIHHRYWDGTVHNLRILIDRSSIEIFINDGEGVMSSRFFPSYPGQITFSGAIPNAFHCWPLRSCMIE